MAFGLFTRSEQRAVKKPAVSSGARKGPPASTAQTAAYFHTKGVDGVNGMNPDARHPCMSPEGSDSPLLYVLGEAPGETEDEQGRPFVGKAGNRLREELDKHWGDGDLRINNVVRTRPPKNRLPTFEEIECFRPSLIDDIQRTKPKAILGCGAVPCTWMFGPGFSTMQTLRGRRMVVKVGDHACYFYPVHHPSYVLRVREQYEVEGAPGSEWDRFFGLDIKRVAKDLPSLPDAVAESDFWSGVRYSKDPDEIVAVLRRFATYKFVATDIETNRKRPYAAGAKILTAALTSAEEGTFVFPVDHPGMRWPAGGREKVQAAFKAFLHSPAVKCAHNAPFEMEWYAYFYGAGVLQAARWHDTMCAAYYLDERAAGLGLNFLTQQHFGFQIKALSKVDRARLEETPLDKVLEYNGPDSKYAYQLHYAQKGHLKAQGLWDVYLHHLPRLVSLVSAQMVGLPVDPEKNAFYQQKVDGEEKAIQKQITALPCMKEFLSRFKTPFSPTSNLDLVRMFRDVLQRPEGKRASNKTGYSTDKEFLKEVEAQEPLAALILQLREVVKLKGTYITPLDRKQKGTVVYPDGRLHTSLNSVFTVSGRTSSDDPNLQNFPSRKNKDVRSQVVPPKGCVMVCVDYGQIEARVIAMHSKDEALTQALWKNYDIHGDWAGRIINAYDGSYQARYGDLEDKAARKKFRADVKNQMVFPAFYGSEMRSIARALDVPERIMSGLFEEFWEMFHGVKAWQEDLKAFYRKYGYVESLIGRRRRGPLSDNMVINVPVQGDASEIVIAAMNRLNRVAHEQECPRLRPVLNIHDDLPFFLPSQSYVQDLRTILPVMCEIPFDWITTPISVEASVGPNWYDQKGIGTYQSHTLENDLKQLDALTVAA